MWIIELRDWTAFLAELIICVYVVREFYYDRDKDLEKKHKKTRTTKKTTSTPGGPQITEETTEVSESLGGNNEKENPPL